MDNIFKSQWLQSMGVFDEKKMMNHQAMDQIQLIEPLQHVVMQLLLLLMVVIGTSMQWISETYPDPYPGIQIQQKNHIKYRYTRR